MMESVINKMVSKALKEIKDTVAKIKIIKGISWHVVSLVNLMNEVLGEGGIQDPPTIRFDGYTKYHHVYISLQYVKHWEMKKDPELQERLEDAILDWAVLHNLCPQSTATSASHYLEMRPPTYWSPQFRITVETGPNLPPQYEKVEEIVENKPYTYTTVRCKMS